ncbi:mitochondrial carrier domain-containing protein [Phycomyces nitens]|nr:mitochondrial carrier domain-containing protein [Phycomyces nitens]
MTLTAYLGLLSPGCSIDNEQDVESDRHESQVSRARLQAQAILDAELSFTTTIIKNSDYPEQRVVARHRYQAFPAYYSAGKDTPWKSARFLWSIAKRDGIRALYPGFGLGLVGQAVAAAYELTLSEFFQSTVVPATAHLGLPWRFLIQAVERRSRRREDRSNSKPKRDDVAMLNTFYPEIACGVASSILARAISYPIDTVMFKLMLQDSGVHKINTTYRGFFDCVYRTWRDEGGIKAFYVGWGAGVLEIVAGYLILEASWLAYRAVEWKLGTHPSGDDHRMIRKARRLRDRLQRYK